MKTNLFISTLLLTMAFSITACGKEADPVVTESVGTPVMEETASITTTETSAEAETIEKAAPVKAAEVPTEEATVVDVAAAVGAYADGFIPEADDYIVTDEELANLPEDEWSQIKRTYTFLCRMDPSLPVNACDNTIGTIYMRYENEELLALLNKDFSKAYDIIEKCGIDVTTEEGKVLKAAEMRTTITDFDSFDKAYGDIINYETEIARVRNEYADKTKAALDAKDATNGKVYLDKWDAMDSFIEPLDEFVEFYWMVYGL